LDNGLAFVAFLEHALGTLGFAGDGSFFALIGGEGRSGKREQQEAHDPC